MSLPPSLPASLRVRLLAGTLVWIVASLAVAGWGLGDLFHRHVETQFDNELKTHLDQLTANLVQDEQGQPSLSTPLSDPRLSRPYSGLYWQIDRIDNADGIGLLRSRSLWDSVIRVPDDTVADGELHRHRASGPQGTTLSVVERTVFPDAHPDQALRLIVAADERWMVEPIDRFRGVLWAALAVLGAGLMIAAVIQVVVGLAPLRRLRRELAAVRNGQSQRLAGHFPAEVEPLIEDFNAVLAQNAEIVERARTQAGNLAHALKTPLAVLANAAAATEDKPDPELARLVLDQVDNARRQVDYHLKRARVAAVRLPGSHTKLAPVVDGLVRLMTRVHDERGLDLVVQPIPDKLAFRGEEQDLQEMLGNLLDNACKWAHGRVEIQVTKAEDALVVVIDDDGTGIAPAQREAMIRRGARADEQVTGSGLGLAIVDDLARLYGGRLELADSPSGGLRARLTLPALS